MARKTLTITLYMSEIVYAIMNKTHLTGRSRETGNNHEEVANMKANEDDENMNQILQSIGTAFSKLKTKLSEYLEETGTTASNIQIEADTDLTLALSMPTNYNEATRDTLSRGAHDYLVHSAISEWFTITNKNDAADYVALAVSDIETIREAINKRTRPVRKAPTTGGDSTTEEQD